MLMKYGLNFLSEKQLFGKNNNDKKFKASISYPTRPRNSLHLLSKVDVFSYICAVSCSIKYTCRTFCIHRETVGASGFIQQIIIVFLAVIRGRCSKNSWLWARSLGNMSNKYNKGPKERFVLNRFPKISWTSIQKHFTRGQPQ